MSKTVKTSLTSPSDRQNRHHVTMFESVRDSSLMSSMTFCRKLEACQTLPDGYDADGYVSRRCACFVQEFCTLPCFISTRCVLQKGEAAEDDFQHCLDSNFFLIFTCLIFLRASSVLIFFKASVGKRGWRSARFGCGRSAEVQSRV